MKRIAVLTSGGDAPGMNAAVRAVVRGALYNKMEVCGIYHGFEGLIDGEIEQFGMSSVSDIIHRGGTVLGTARSKRFMEKEGFKTAVKNLKGNGIDGLVVIGGDGSFRGALTLLRADVAVIGVPGTIDNDLGYTDYTIGFDTAVNTVVELCGNIRDTSVSHGRATVMEVMGRHCGDIALHAGLAAGAESILIPEKKLDLDAVCRKMLAGKSRGKLHSLIMKAEGVEMGTAELAQELEKRTGIPTKTVVPGYIQRGGSPTFFDRNLATRLGYRAVSLLKDGQRGRCVGIHENKIMDVDIEEAIDSKNPSRESMLELADILS